MEAAGASETSVNKRLTKYHYIPEDSHLHKMLTTNDNRLKE
jgi:hypothetical protein